MSVASRAAKRAVDYPERIADFQREGNDRSALGEAIRWLLAEVAASVKLTPRRAPAMYQQLTERIVQMAKAVSSGWKG